MYLCADENGQMMIFRHQKKWCMVVLTLLSSVAVVAQPDLDSLYTEYIATTGSEHRQKTDELVRLLQADDWLDSTFAANKHTASQTLMAIGIEREYMDATIRFSFSIFTTEEEIDATLAALEELLPLLRRYTRR